VKPLRTDRCDATKAIGPGVCRSRAEIDILETFLARLLDEVITSQSRSACRSSQDWAFNSAARKGG
jgi:hypothetical protein